MPPPPPTSCLGMPLAQYRHVRYAAPLGRQRESAERGTAPVGADVPKIPRTSFANPSTRVSPSSESVGGTNGCTSSAIAPRSQKPAGPRVRGFATLGAGNPRGDVGSTPWPKSSRGQKSVWLGEPLAVREGGSLSWPPGERLRGDPLARGSRALAPFPLRVISATDGYTCTVLVRLSLA